MNTKVLAALVFLTILGVSTGGYAYSSLTSVQDANIQSSNSNVTITDSNVTVTNSTIIIGQGDTLIYPTATPTPTPSQTGNPANSSATAPQITSVSPISASQTQTITIKGSGFGDIQPQLSSLGDGSVDTVWGGSTPALVVYDKTNLLSAGATGNWPGFTNGPPDLIGVIIVSWTNTQIVLGGFGSGLDSQFSWSQVSQGDTLQIQIQTTGGLATFNIVAA